MQITIERAIEPGLPIIDAHHHLWDRPGSRYLPADLRQDINGHNVTKTVFVECWSGHRPDGPEELKPLGETEFVLAVTRQAPPGVKIAAGIVAFADLKLGERAARVIEGHRQIAGKRLKGIRYVTAWDPSPFIQPYMNSPQGLLLDTRFQQGIACLRKYDLTLDVATLYHQIPEVRALAQKFPETVIILDHVGGPIMIGPYAGREEEVRQDWRKHIKALAECPNVVVKLGGLGLRHTGFGWHERKTQPGAEELAAAMRPWFMWCIEHFGVKGCMLESNFPEDKVSFSYSTMWNAFKLLTRDFTKAERDALFHDTAARVYKL